ncbi:cytochrome c-type biogenesis protein CcmH [Octadecabacter sp. 1_MG-2023]|uniref:cytochrome c-type biogenesis protein n=1 Tax=unclassified Octadecabacter TaxID=196158 RepID=UPI001C085B08|nr:MULTISPECIES: cytochrome c-type biogenesis protein [unclassified Octadecabacter]MBU2993451.1 cytochrome c-type biogenesis protein CcmH [Octadecabacter sp. B2R22]MDO6733093.1 cytochrome c-type biogenesis protein CcmH [Octadecabacter sp. 1_MG-2023]
MRWLVLVLCLLAAPLAAVQPDEVLDDPALETRARDLSAGLRCPVCRNESIDESNAGISRDLRLLLRERLVAGDTDEQAIAFLVDRYGDYILLKPTTDGANILLWLAAPIMLLLAGGVAVGSVRARSKAAVPEDLSDDEQKRLEEILKD